MTLTPKTVTVCHVGGVTASPTSKPGCVQYLIDVTAVANQHGLCETYQFQTLNQWRASIFQRAKELGRSVRVTWKPTAFGRKVLEAQLEGEPAA